MHTQAQHQMSAGACSTWQHLPHRQFRAGTLQQRRAESLQRQAKCTCHSQPPRCLAAATAAAAPAQVELTADDKWIQRTLSSQDRDHTSQLPALQKLRHHNTDILKTMRMPTNRTEAYRFTDLAPILAETLQVKTGEVSQETADQRVLDKDPAHRLVIVDGAVSAQLSSTVQLPDGVFIGSLQDTSDQATVDSLGQQAAAQGNALPFVVLNGAFARDVACVSVPAGVKVQQPLHILYLSTEGQGSATAFSSPRLLVRLGQGSSLELVEEFAAGPQQQAKYFTNAVAEVQLEEGAQLTHGYVEVQSSSSFHTKATMVRQAARSSYTCNEAAVGAAISRHDLSIEQVGEATSTTLRGFTVCGEGQLHDLHSKLLLNHPEGQAKQLHKCIASAATGRGVFDGNVRVGKLAQKTDAQQLSRNLLLVPRATVSVKPNLQIIADDVKCSHGCAVSDLEEDQMFYFRARGIHPDAARQILVHSFGAEVTQHLKHKQLLERIESVVAATLAKAPLVPADSVQTQA